MRGTTNKQVRRVAKGVAVLATAALGLGVVTGVAVAAPAADPCAYFVRGIEAYYNHCTSDGSHIEIRLNMVGEFDKNRCVGPGTTHLGGAHLIRGARYTGKLCPR
jgi:hypothetical protein